MARISRNLGPAITVAALVLVLTGVRMASGQQASSLPPGAARQVVEQKCGVCHELGRILRSGYDRNGWR